MDDISYAVGCFYLMDRGYVDYKRLYKIEVSKAFFVTRSKQKMSYVIKEKRKTQGQVGVLKDEMVAMRRWHTRRWYPMHIRRVEYRDEATGLHLKFLTNVLLDATIIARLYKVSGKWICFFLWIKQNLRIKRFYGNSENAVKTQIWIAVCDNLLIAVVKKG